MNRKWLKSLLLLRILEDTLLLINSKASLLLYRNYERRNEMKLKNLKLLKMKIFKR